MYLLIFEQFLNTCVPNPMFDFVIKCCCLLQNRNSFPDQFEFPALMTSDRLMYQNIIALIPVTMMSNVILRRLSTSTRCYSSTKSEKLVLSKFRNGVQEITLNSPSTRNALSLNMLDELREQFAAYHNHQDLRVIVIKGNI